MPTAALSAGSAQLEAIVDREGERTVTIPSRFPAASSSPKPRTDRRSRSPWTVAAKKAPFDRPGISMVAGLLGDFPGVPVARELRKGDQLTAGFTVLDTPGPQPATSPSGGRATAC